MFSIILKSIVGAFVNRVRGLHSAFVWLGGAVLGAAVYWYSMSWWAAVIIGLAYVLGESFGWTRWIHGASGRYNVGLDTGTKDGSLFVTKLIADEKNEKWFHQVGMTVRGLWWWVPVFGAMWWFSLTPLWAAIAGAVFVSVMFYPVYALAFRMKVGEFRYLQKAEVLYGLVYGAAIGVALIV